MITDLIYLALDDTERITIRFNNWEVIFHTLYTEQCVSTLLNEYNTLSVFIPDHQRASIQVNPSNLSKSTIVPTKSKPTVQSNRQEYIQAMITMLLLNRFIQL